MLLTICSICTYSQHAVLEIEELCVANVTVSLNDEIFEEEEFDGPYINLKCELINRGRNDFIIYPSKSDIYITFNCDGVEYKSDVEAMPFTDKEVQVVKSRQVVYFRVGAYLLLGTPFWSENKSDYKDVLLRILPTIRVRYKDMDIDCYSTRIRKVKVL